MKTFGHQRPIRLPTGEVIGKYDAPVFRQTEEPLGGQFGRDKRKPLVVMLKRGDVIEAWPKGTQQKLSCTAADFYMWLVKCKANKSQLERARLKKEQKAARRESQRVARADAKRRADLRAERQNQ